MYNKGYKLDFHGTGSTEWKAKVVDRGGNRKKGGRNSGGNHQGQGGLWC